MPKLATTTSATLPRLSRREQQYMDILHQRGGATVSEVLGDLVDPPGYSAVRATLNVLVNKGHARYVADGPRYVYRPALSAGMAQQAAIHHLVTTFFGGSAEQAAAALLEMADVKLPKQAVDQLTRRIDSARKEGR